MIDRSLVRLSKFLSYVLRHHPEKIGLRLDASGWADVDELLEKATVAGTPLTAEALREVVERNDKQRFAFSPDQRRIRASQGHSIAVDLGLAPTPPPEHLYHGTTANSLESIRAEGLLPGSRTHVHLSADVPTARKVGSRHGRPIVLTVRAGEMARAGHRFYRSANGVWLTDRVPAGYLSVPDAADQATTSSGPSFGSTTMKPSGPAK